MLGYLPTDIICSLEANSFPRAKLEESIELRGTGNVQGHISEHIFTPNGDYCLYIRSRDDFRPIASKQKDLMDYNVLLCWILPTRQVFQKYCSYS